MTSVDLYQILLLLVIFQFKHFLADYILQGRYMLGKFSRTGWVAPLSAHCGVHFLFTFSIALMFTTPVISLAVALCDFIIHFTMDRIKASPSMLGRYKVTEKEFWWSLGLDQSVHHLTHYAIIAVLVVY